MMGHPLDRPPGLAPRGTSMGLGLITTFAPIIPASTAMALSPWFGDGDSGLPIALACVAVWGVIAIPLIIGFKFRRYWGVILYFYVGAFCVIALPVALTVLAIVLVVTVHHQPPTFFYMWFGVLLLPMIPFWPFLLRALRLKYWQPWTRPDQWEVGDERIAGWVFDVAGVPRRPDQMPVPTTPPKAVRLKPTPRRKR